MVVIHCPDPDDCRDTEDEDSYTVYVWANVDTVIRFEGDNEYNDPGLIFVY